MKGKIHCGSIAAVCFGLLAMSLVYASLSVSSAARGDEMAVLASPPGYGAACKEAIRTGKPLVIEVSAAWCGPCREVERQYGVDLRAAGVFVHVDLDRDRAWLERSRIEVDTVPAVLVYARKNSRWVAPRIEIGLPRIGIYIGELRKQKHPQQR